MSVRVAGSRGLRAMAVLVLLVLLAAACGSDGGGDEPAVEGGDPQPGGTLAFGLAGDSLGWLPANQIWSQPGYIVAQAVFDRLMAYDADGNVHPYLAESVTPNEDFTQWTFGLREGVRFHDGTPFDAEALRVNFDAMKSSAVWGGAFGSVEAFEVVDPLTLVVQMNAPFSTFPHLLTAQPGFVAAPAQIASGDATNPIGTGPFVWDEWQEGTRISVQRNDDYWREGFPYLDGIEFSVLPDSTTRRDAVRSGELDIIEVTDAEILADFEEDREDFVVYVDEEGETTEVSLMLNAARLPFSDPKAREAVALAIDREQVSDVVFDSGYEPANGFIREGSPWYRDVDFPSYEPERAQELAAEYEAEHGEPISFTFQIVADPVEAEVAQLVQSQLAAIGMDVEITTVDATTAIVNLAAANFDMGYTTLLWGSQHPDREYMVIHGSNSGAVGDIVTNITRTEDERIDVALDAARTTDVLQQQVDQWEIVQERLAELNTFVYIVHTDIGEAATTAVQDVQNWTFPDGTEGRPQEQTVLSLYQVWLAQ